MTYLLIRVHSWECDVPGCGTEEEHAEWSKAGAIKTMRKYGWRILPGDRAYCPAHAKEKLP